MHLRGDAVRVAERPLAIGIRLRLERASDGRRELGSAIERRERGAEPLAVRSVASLDEKAEAHEVARDAGGNDARPDIVARLGAATNERLLVGYALPLARHDVQPNIARIPRETFARRREMAWTIMEDLSRRGLEQALSRRHQPIGKCDLAERIEAERGAEVGVRIVDFDPMRHRLAFSDGTGRRTPIASGGPKFVE